MPDSENGQLRELLELAAGSEWPRQPRVRWPLVVLLVTALLVLGAAGVAVLRGMLGGFVFQAHPWGRCMVIDPSFCRDLTAEGIEGVAGIELPDATHIERSGSSSGLLNYSVMALLELPQGGEAYLDPKWAEDDPGSARRPDVLEEYGLGQIDRSVRQGRSQILFASDAEGRSWVYVVVQGKGTFIPWAQRTSSGTS